MAGKESMNDCPKCCIQCIASCEVMLQMAISDSKWVKQYAKLCGEICLYCAEQCQQHAHDHCKKCAESCRQCAEACLALV